MKLIAESLIEFLLNEEVVATMGNMGGYEGEVTIYKNPPSVRRMSPWARAVTDHLGNFYIADDEMHKDEDLIYTTHFDMIEVLRDEISDFMMEWDSSRDSIGYIRGIAWQRYSKTNQFFLSESYSDFDLDHIKSYAEGIMNKPSFFKPLGVKFVLEVINTLDHQESDYDRMMKQLKDGV